MNLVTAFLLLAAGSIVIHIDLFRVDTPVRWAAVLGILCDLFDVELEGGELLLQGRVRARLENLRYEAGLH